MAKYPFITLIFAAAVAGQVGPQALLLPACIKACDPAAIASVNCTNPDQYCHCVRQDGILANITPCANIECADPSASMYTFTTLFGEVCQKFNITVPVVGSNLSANGTNVTYTKPSPSVVPYTGGGSRSMDLNCAGSIMVAGSVALTFFATFDLAF